MAYPLPGGAGHQPYPQHYAGVHQQGQHAHPMTHQQHGYQQQQQQHYPHMGPPLPAGPPPPPPPGPSQSPGLPPMSAEQAAQWKDYGYGNTAPRAGAGPHRHNAGKNSHYPPNAAPPHSSGSYLPHPPPHSAHQPQQFPPAPQDGHYPHMPAGGPPAKRPRYDAAPLASPAHPQPPPLTYQGPHQPRHLQQYPAHQPPPLAQPFHHNAGLPPNPMQHQAGRPPHHPPPHHQQQNQRAQHPLPLAVAPMKPARQQHGNNPQNNILQPAQALPPPPPPVAVPPPPPPAPASSLPAKPSGSIRLDQKGAATLPPTPIGASMLPPTPVTSGPTSDASATRPASNAGSMRRDTRPMPSSGRNSSQDQDSRSQRGSQSSAFRDSRGGGRGGRGGPAMGGRGSGRGGGTLQHRRGGRSDQFDSRSSVSVDSQGPRLPQQPKATLRGSGKRPFPSSASNASSPSGPRGFNRQRTDSNTTVTSTNFNPRAGKTVKSGPGADASSASKGAGIPLGSKVPTGPKNATAPLPRGDKGGNLTKKERKALVQAKPGASPSVANATAPLKKTLTDFRIQSLEIVELGWKWIADSLHASADPAEHPPKEEGVEEQPKAGGDGDISDNAEPESNADVVQAEGEAEGEAEGGAGTAEAEPNAVAAAPLVKTESVQSDAGTVTRKEKRKHDDEEEDEALERAEHQAEGDDVKERKKVKSEAIDVTAEGPIDNGTDDSEQASENEVPQEAQDGSTLTEGVAASIVDPDSSLVRPAARARSASAPTFPTEKADNERASSVADETISNPDPDTSARASELESDNDEQADELDDDGDATSESSGEGDDQDEEDDEAEVAEEMLKKPASPTVEPADLAKGAADAALALSVETERAGQVVHSATGARRTLQHKSRENSRLRIYFCSPVALEQKEVRKHLAQDAGTESKLGKNAKKKARKDLEGASEPKDSLKEAKPDEKALSSKEEEQEKATQADGDVDGLPLDLPTSAEAGEADPVLAENAARSDGQEQQGEADEPVSKVNTDTPTGSIVETPTPPALSTPSPDRLSISYARNSRRLVVDADSVESMTVRRQEGRIDVRLQLVPAAKEESSARYFRGLYLETVRPASSDFAEVDRAEIERAWSKIATPAHPEQNSDIHSRRDQLLPPLHQLLGRQSATQATLKPKDDTADVQEESKLDGPGLEGLGFITVTVYLDRYNPLTEAKWVRTGTPDDWIASVLGNLASTPPSKPQHQEKQSADLPDGEASSAATTGNDSSNVNTSQNQASCAWKGKIKVADPDAPPTFQHALENWLSTSNARYGFDEARYRFVNKHFQDVNNVLEVLLRLMRMGAASPSHNPSASHAVNGRAAGGHGNGLASSGGNLGQQSCSLLSSAKAAQAPYPEQQTPVSLAAFQIFKLGMEAAVDPGTTKPDWDRKVGEIVRGLPYTLVFRALDSMFSDFKKIR